MYKTFFIFAANFKEIYQMNVYPCLLCIGSNYDRPIHIEAARKSLIQHFPDIRFGEEMETEAIGDRFYSPFSNQLAHFHTSLSMNEVKAILKEIESNNHRLAEDKAKGIVKLDIDILIFDHEVIKEDDLQRDYIQKGMKALQIPNN